MECENDRISELPPCILHRILSHLRTKEVVQTSSLSKLWHSVWSSFPEFEFCFYDHNDQDIDKFALFVDNSLRRFLSQKLLINKFYLNCYDFNPYLSSQYVDEWIELVLANGVSELSLCISSNPRDESDPFVHHYILPRTTFGTRFYSLETLYLENIRVNESIIKDIIRNCPNLKRFHLAAISGLKTLEISNLEKLTDFDVSIDRGPHEIESVHIDAINLKSFGFTSFESDLSCTVTLDPCPDLRCLQLEDCSITDEAFNSILSSCPLIEDVFVSRCNSVRRILISAQNLWRLYLSRCSSVEVIEIDAPSLSSFEYDTCVMPLIFSKKTICPMEISYSLFENESRELVGSWFLKLRELVEASKQIKKFELTVYSVEVMFNLDELEEDMIPPKVGVDHLELTSCHVRRSMDYSTLMEALLWSCHPKRISIKCESSFEKRCIRALCKKLLDNKPPKCCSFSRVKCWRHDFKTAEVQKFGVIENDDSRILNWRILLKTLPSLKSNDQVCFKLQWDF